MKTMPHMHKAEEPAGLHLMAAIFHLHHTLVRMRDLYLCHGLLAIYHENREVFHIIGMRNLKKKKITDNFDSDNIF